MRKLTLALLSALWLPLLFAGTPAVSPDPLPSAPDYVRNSGTWNLAFQDEFTGPSLDLNNWTTCYWWDKKGCTNRGNNELQWYLPEGVSVSNGALNLTAKRKQVTGSDGENYPYVSGMVTTGRPTSDKTQKPKFAFQYGFAEIRAKVPAGQGIWPAFWILPLSHESKPEIDVVEILGDNPSRIYLTLHYKDAQGEDARERRVWDGPDFSKDWHTYGVRWEPGKLVYYIDGVERWRFSDSATPIVPDEPMYLLLNLAVGGDWAGPPNTTTRFPSTYAIDYVRVWELGQ